MFISGGRRTNATNKCYSFNISTNTLERKEDMNEARSIHGLSKMDQKIFVFGGVNDDWIEMKSAEVYDGVKNLWNDLPDMPQVGSWITCIQV